MEKMTPSYRGVVKVKLDNCFKMYISFVFMYGEANRSGVTVIEKIVCYSQSSRGVCAIWGLTRISQAVQGIEGNRWARAFIVVLVEQND